MNTACEQQSHELGLHVQGYAGDDQLGEALKGADVIIIPAGVPRKPGMTRDDLFKVCAVLRCSWSYTLQHSCCHHSLKQRAL